MAKIQHQKYAERQTINWEKHLQLILQMGTNDPNIDRPLSEKVMYYFLFLIGKAQEQIQK